MLGWVGNREAETERVQAGTRIRECDGETDRGLE